MDYEIESFKISFNKLGLKKGDSIFLSTSLGMLGKAKNTKRFSTIADGLLDSLIDIIGPNGNIFVPTYSYSFGSKRKIFSVKNTKSKLGQFPNFFLKKKNILRSIDPMISVAGMGKDVKNILNKISHTSYGKNCVFERLLKLKNLKCCNVGLGNNWVPFMHYVDWLNKVPFRYDKYFEGTIIDKNNKKKKYVWHYPVREMSEKYRSNGYRIGMIAKKKKLFKRVNFCKSQIFLISYREFFNLLIKETKKNIYLTTYAK